MDILVNKSHLLDKDFVPDNLVSVYNPYYVPSIEGGKLLLRADILEYFNCMSNDSLKNGIILFVDSGYRSYEYQSKLLEYNLKINGDIAYNRVAPPGGSEHQTGLCVDIATIIDGIYTGEINEDMEVYNYLINNCYKFGFILRYPKGKENITLYDFEPWHYRYVGNEVAKYIMLNNMTLEEYHLEKNKKLLLTI